MNKELRDALKQFKESVEVINKLYDHQLDEDYPFDKSFDEMAYDINIWLEKI